VVSIDEPRSITDLGEFSIPPLSEKEAKKLIINIINNEDYEFSNASQEYLFNKLKWLLPYFIHVLMSEIESICIDKETHNITQEIIDEAFKNALRHRSYFEHWVSRLRIVFKKDDFSCAKEILNIAAGKDRIGFYELQDVIAKYKIDDPTVLINALLHDGYLVKEEDKNYRFNSPLLQQWWLLNIAI
jgi:hypothetical protein